MSVRDFGHFDAPLVLFGGAQSNLRALEALARIVGDGVAISTGGLIGAGAETDETVAKARALGWHWVAGAGDKEGIGALKRADREWLAGLPDMGTFVQNGRRYAVLNSTATSLSRGIWPITSEADIAQEIARVEAQIGTLDGLVAGHSGVAFHRQIGSHQWISPGAIGVPPNDGRPETRYAALIDGDVVIHRLSYDYEAAAAAIDTAGGKGNFAAVLRTGLWASEDTLPFEMRR